MLVTFSVHAPDGERYSQRGFDLMAARKVPLLVPGPPPVTGTGTLERAVVEPGGESAELTAEVADDSAAGRAVIAAAGGLYGHVRILEDGTAAPLIFRRRHPAEAARLIREGYAARGWPAELAEAVIEETLADGA